MLRIRAELSCHGEEPLINAVKQTPLCNERVPLIRTRDKHEKESKKEGGGDASTTCAEGFFHICMSNTKNDIQILRRPKDEQKNQV